MTGHKGERKQNHLSSSALGTEGNRKKSPANKTCMSPNGTHRSRATCAMKSNRLKTWSADHGHLADGPVHQQHPRLPNPSRFTGFVTSFASTWRAMSVADPRASPVAAVKRCGESFPIIIGSYAPCAAASARPQTYLVTAGGPPEKIHGGRTDQERRLASCSSMMIQGNRPLDRCDDPDEHTPGQRCSSKTKRSSNRNQPGEGKRPMRPKLNSELEPWRQAPALQVHRQKLAAVFTFLELEVQERLDDQATVASKWPLRVVEMAPSLLFLEITKSITAMPMMTCETRKCSTASDGEVLWIEAGRFLTSFFSWSTRIWSSEKILKIGRGPNFSLHAQGSPADREMSAVGSLRSSYIPPQGHWSLARHVITISRQRSMALRK